MLKVRVTFKDIYFAVDVLVKHSNLLLRIYVHPDSIYYTAMQGFSFLFHRLDFDISSSRASSKHDNECQIIEGEKETKFEWNQMVVEVPYLWC